MTVGHYAPTSDDSPLAALRRKWWIPLILIPLCTLLGVGYGSTQSPKYTAQARLAVAAADSTAYTIAGFPLSAQSLAADYARWVTNNAAAGDIPAGGAAISASPVPDSAVVLVEAISTDQNNAVKAAQTASTKLVDAVKAAKGQADPNAAYKSYASLADDVAKAQAANDLAVANMNSAIGAKESTSTINKLRDARVKTGATLSLVQAKQSAALDLYRRLYAQTPSVSNLTLVSNASVISNDRKSILQKMGLIGFGAGAVLSLILAALLNRRGRRAEVVAEAPAHTTRVRETTSHVGADRAQSDTTTTTSEGATAATERTARGTDARS